MKPSWDKIGIGRWALRVNGAGLPLAMVSGEPGVGYLWTVGQWVHTRPRPYPSGASATLEDATAAADAAVALFGARGKKKKRPIGGGS